MANRLLTTDLVANTMLADLVVNSAFVQTSSRTLQSEWFKLQYALGDTVNVRKKRYPFTGDGQVAQLQGWEQASLPVTINHDYHAAFSFSTVERMLDIEDYRQEIGEPTVKSIVADLEGDIARDASFELNHYVGTPGSPINSYASVDAVATRMRILGMRVDNNATLALSSNDAFSLRSSLVGGGNFTPVFNDKLIVDSKMGHISAFDVWESPLMYRQIAGSPGAGPITVATAVGSGTSISMTGFTASTLVARQGDRFTITADGLFSERLLDHRSTNLSPQFVVAEDATSDGAGAATIIVKHPIVTTQTMSKNITIPIPVGAVVTFLGSHNVNIGYIAYSSLTFVAPKMVTLASKENAVAVDEKNKLSLRVVFDADTLQNQEFARYDLISGAKWDSEHAVVLVS